LKFFEEALDGDDSDDEELEDEDVTLDRENQDCLDKFQDILKKCRRVVTFVHQSSNAIEALSNKQKAADLPMNKLVQDMQVRWNSTYLMLERLYEQIDFVNELIMDFEINDCTTFNTEEKKNIYNIVCVLKYFYEATLQFSKTQFASISLVLPIFNALIDHMALERDDPPVSVALKTMLKHYTKFYFKKYTEKNLSTYVTVSFLDVRTKLFGRIDESKRKQYLKIANETIRSTCLAGPINISQLVNTQDIHTSSTQSIAKKPTIPSKLQFFDIEQNVTKSKTQAKKRYRKRTS
jgi:hypothetical protein